MKFFKFNGPTLNENGKVTLKAIHSFDWKRKNGPIGWPVDDERVRLCSSCNVNDPIQSKGAPWPKIVGSLLYLADVASPSDRIDLRRLSKLKPKDLLRFNATFGMRKRWTKPSGGFICMLIGRPPLLIIGAEYSRHLHLLKCSVVPNLQITKIEL